MKSQHHFLSASCGLDLPLNTSHLISPSQPLSLKIRWNADTVETTVPKVSLPQKSNRAHSPVCLIPYLHTQPPWPPSLVFGCWAVLFLHLFLLLLLSKSHEPRFRQRPSQPFISFLCYLVIWLSFPVLCSCILNPRSHNLAWTYSCLQDDFICFFF